MSKLRNTLGALRRSRHTTVITLAAGSLAAGLLAACSSDASNPTAPVAAKAPATSGPSAYQGATASTTVAAIWNSIDAQWQKTPTQLASMWATWHTQPTDMQAGTRVPELFACSFVSQSVGTTVQTINPSTSTQVMQVGRMTLTFPAGAVTSSVMVAATATYDQNGVNIDFQPHGYKFAKAVKVDVTYQGCATRFSSPLDAFYLNDSGGIIQTMPSTDDRANGTIHALTDHFSHYMIAWS